jgi:hypothetical protein
MLLAVSGASSALRSPGAAARPPQTTTADERAHRWPDSTLLSAGVVREIGWGLAVALVVVRILTRIHS